MERLLNDMSATTAFGGSDSVILINGVACGEILNFKYSTKNETIDIEVGMFGEVTNEITCSKAEELLSQLSNATIEQIFVNEQGYSSYRVFTGVNFEYQSGTVDADAIVQMESYHFDFCKNSKVYIIPISMKTSDAIKEIKNRLGINGGVE